MTPNPSPTQTGGAITPTASPAAIAPRTWLAVRAPLAWTRTARRRRLLFVALAAPGFLAVFTTPLHQSLPILVLGLALFAAALVFRRRSERVFARAEAAALWPPPPPASREP